jgi:hypothetical protein
MESGVRVDLSPPLLTPQGVPVGLGADRDIVGLRLAAGVLRHAGPPAGAVASHGDRFRVLVAPEV